MLRAEYCVRKNQGYVVVLLRQYWDKFLGYYWEDVDIYEAGNSSLDSQGHCGYGTLDRNTLSRFARQTARDMLIEHDAPDGRIDYNGDLMSRD